MSPSRQRAHLAALVKSPRAAHLHSPNGLKATARRANDIAQEVQAENELLMTEAQLLHAIEEVLAAKVHDLEEKHQHLQAAHRQLRLDNESLEAVIEECNLAITIARRDVHRLEAQLRKYQRRPQLTRKQRQQLQILKQTGVSIEVLRRWADSNCSRLDTHGRPGGTTVQPTPEPSPPEPTPGPSPPEPSDFFIPTQEAPPGKPAASTAAACGLQIHSATNPRGYWATSVAAVGRGEARMSKTGMNLNVKIRAAIALSTVHIQAVKLLSGLPSYVWAVGGCLRPTSSRFLKLLPQYLSVGSWLSRGSYMLMRAAPEASHTLHTTNPVELHPWHGLEASESCGFLANELVRGVTGILTTSTSSAVAVSAAGCETGFALAASGSSSICSQPAAQQLRSFREAIVEGVNIRKLDIASVGAEDTGLSAVMLKWPAARPRGTDQRRGRVVLVDEHRTSRVSSAVNGQQPCESRLSKGRATRPADWMPPAGQVEHRLLRPAWSQQRDQPVRGLMWSPVVGPRKPPQAPCQLYNMALWVKQYCATSEWPVAAARLQLNVTKPGTIFDESDHAGHASEQDFHKLADTTLDELHEVIEAYVEGLNLDDSDVEYSQGVLSVKLGKAGTYVLNKQAPNRQIWLSSPVSGPLRFDWDSQRQQWVYHRDGRELLSLLDAELTKLCGQSPRLTPA
ncbi:hypothetical protein QJQ45_007916 [Haematococcus lacustris]|nr:hypothetical protein QJQ45_007916 [Haematococcus lacustris]